MQCKYFDQVEMAMGIQQLGAQSRVLVPAKAHYGVHSFREAHPAADDMRIFVGYKEEGSNMGAEANTSDTHDVHSKDVPSSPSLATLLMKQQCDAAVATAYTTVPTVDRALTAVQANTHGISTTKGNERPTLWYKQAQ